MLTSQRALTSAFLGLVWLASLPLALSQSTTPDKFRQLDEELRSPNVYRNASGAPGPKYWQQKVDYVIDVRLDDETQMLHGYERVTYENHSPDTLDYLWVQIDQNRFQPEARAALIETAPDIDDKLSLRRMKYYLARESFEGGATIHSVRNAETGEDLHTALSETMLRIDLPAPLPPEGTFSFELDWSHRIVDAKTIRARGGYEYFEEDDNYLYEIAQWFPRLAAYTDYEGWNNKQFLGSGEFTLEFGDYLVSITAPADHVVCATGELVNSQDVLEPVWRERLDQARASDVPLFIITPEEAEKNEAARTPGTKTWTFDARNVRDFAWASSRKFIWDAAIQKSGDLDVLCMSYYPKEGEPLWSRYSTHSIQHTIEVYSRFTFDYPYPIAISVNGPIGGMEYPMICFNGPRPEKDGTYTKRTKYGLISVIIHEVGHNYFPMIVNSDERQWTWMDEGLNTFCQFLAEQEWEEDYPSWRGEPHRITGYMEDEKQVPIMTNSESLLQFGNNAYAKPATALNVLRETVMGRELFDFAFRTYSQRWEFKRPTPEDLFRTMEDASAVDLDWFWRGWFYTTDHVDIALGTPREFVLETRDPDVDKPERKAERDEDRPTLSEQRNEKMRADGLKTRAELYPELVDFYNEFDALDVTESDREAFVKWMEGLEPDESKTNEAAQKRFFYMLDFTNEGGLVMPLPLEIELADGSTEEIRLPVEIWRRNPEAVTKMLMTEQEIVRVQLDPYRELADTDRADNVWPRKPEKSRFQLFKDKKSKNPMQKAKAAEEKAAKKLEEEADKAADEVPGEARETREAGKAGEQGEEQ